MYDQAFYDDAAAAIPAETFWPLRWGPNWEDPKPDMTDGVLYPASVLVHFTPGDATLYQILIAVGGYNEAIIAVVNMNLVFQVPWGDGAHVHSTYLAGQLLHRDFASCTMWAVAAVANRAIAACTDNAKVK